MATLIPLLFVLYISVVGVSLKTYGLGSSGAAGSMSEKELKKQAKDEAKRKKDEAKRSKEESPDNVSISYDKFEDRSVVKFDTLIFDRSGITARPSFSAANSILPVMILSQTRKKGIISLR